MILDEQQKKEIKKRIYEIDSMDKRQLHEFVQKWYLAKEDLDSTVFSWVLKGCDIKEAELQEISDISPMAIMSELPTLD